jgi:hypothetical protein
LKSVPSNGPRKRRKPKWQETLGKEGLEKLATRQDLSNDDLKKVARIKHDHAREKAINLIAGGSSVGEALSLAYLPDNTVVTERGENV